MLKSGFFSSIEGDRVYSAEDMSALYEGLLTDGVVRGVGADLAVRPHLEGMKVSVDTGKAVISGKWLSNTDSYDLTVAEAHANYQRIDLIVVRVDYTAREVTLAVKTGSAATSPVAPVLENSSEIKEIPLARVKIPANATTISASQIEDWRQYASVDNMKNNAAHYISTRAFFAATATDTLNFAFYQQDGEVSVKSLEVNDNKLVQVVLQTGGIEVPAQSTGYLGVKILMPGEIGYIPEDAVVSFMAERSVHLVGQQTDDLGRRVYVFTSDSAEENALESVMVSFMLQGECEEMNY